MAQQRKRMMATTDRSDANLLDQIEGMRLDGDVGGIHALSAELLVAMLAELRGIRQALEARPITNQDRVKHGQRPRQR